MASGLVINYEYDGDKHTEVFTASRVRIGFNEDCDLRLRPASAAPFSASGQPLLELERFNGEYRITRFDAQPDLTLNQRLLVADHLTSELGEHAGELIIKDSDEIHFPSLALVFRFYPLTSTQTAVVRRSANENNANTLVAPRQNTYVAPFIENATLESAATARRDDAKVFLREFTRELMREISPLTKIGIFLIAALLVTSVFYLGAAMQRTVKQSRDQIYDINQQMTQMQARIATTGDMMQSIDENNEQIRSALSPAVKVFSDYGNGVCLISGTYMFVDTQSGKALRYAAVERDDEGVPLPLDAGGGATLTATGSGSIAYFDFVGTGFHVGDGYILTNRHVAAEPWTADERAQILQGSTGGRPRLTKLVAYFPNRRTPVTLRLRQASTREDIAVCTMDDSEVAKDIPVLPLDVDAKQSAVGTEVVMMGFPSGPERLLAVLPDDESRAARARYSSSLEKLLNHLAGRSLVTPLTTRGTITDLHARRIVYDARTAEGGSGAPLFGIQNRVIGINFAVFTENTASNLAVPVRFAVPTLKQAGWTSPESDADKQATPASVTGEPAPANANANARPADGATSSR